MTDTRIHVSCLKESEWGELHEFMRHQTETLQRMDKRQDRILRKIYGNGENGLDTDVKMLQQSNKRLWWLWSSIGAVVIAAAIKVTFFANAATP